MSTIKSSTSAYARLQKPALPPVDEKLRRVLVPDVSQGEIPPEQRLTHFQAQMERATLVFQQLAQGGWGRNMAELFRMCTVDAGHGEQQALQEVHVPGSQWPAVGMSYQELEDRSNQVARWARLQSLHECGTVGLMMENCAWYVVTWLGLSKAGVSVAFINTTLRSKQLAHAFEVAGLEVAIVSHRYKNAMATAQSLMQRAPSLYWSRVLPDESVCAQEHFDECVVGVSNERTPLEWGQDLGDTFGYIYTSGTTGMPKATIIPHMRAMAVGLRQSNDLMGFTPQDRLYCTLPLFHSSGGTLATGACLASACCLVIREKFSARNFLSDIRAHGCTATIYIGELFSFLMEQPRKHDDADNPLRTIVGNGLRANVWQHVVQRYGIRHVKEFFGMTEGGTVCNNMVGRPGACGWFPPGQWQEFFPLIEFDVRQNAEKRYYSAAQGARTCRMVETGQVGEAVGVVQTGGLKKFAGYSNKEATEKKLYRDVFERGDVYFKSGDLLRADPDGFVHFYDRIGDTFRWKGENVSTNEVCEAVQRFSGVREALVYGVKLGENGRCGMALSTLEAELWERGGPHDPAFGAALFSHVDKELSSYAQPVFLRVPPPGSTANKTATFKFHKVDYQKQGFDPVQCGDDVLLYRNAAKRRYVVLTKDMFQHLRHANSKL